MPGHITSFSAAILSMVIPANSHGRFLVVPVESTGDSLLPESHSRQRASVLSTFASGSPCYPLEDSGIHTRDSKRASEMPPQEPFAIHVCVTARMAPRERSRPSQNKSFTARVFQNYSLSCSRSTSKRLIVSTSNPTSSGFRRKTSAPAAPAKGTRHQQPPCRFG